MHVDLRKQSHILFFIVFLPIISLGIGWFFAQIIPNAPFWVETISPLAAYGLLFAFFDKFAWHWPIFRWLGIVSCPDIRGRWLGEQISSATDKQNRHIKSRVILEVDQTFSSVHTETYYYKWRSSTTAAQFIAINSEPHLVIMFESEPKADYDGDSSAHRGVVKLTQRPDKTLVGTYFNANGNHGELKFHRIGYTLRRTFESTKSDK
jgi:hypothetical protein